MVQLAVSVVVVVVVSTIADPTAVIENLAKAEASH
jgi:hypothetical protein